MSKKTGVLPRVPPLLDQYDIDLIHATLQGNQKSFEILMHKYQPPIFLMVHRHLRQREEAEDITQQVFFKAYQHLENFRGGSKILHLALHNRPQPHTQSRPAAKT